MINYTGDKMTLFETEYIGNNRCNVYLCGVCIASYKIKNPYSPKAPDERWLEIGPGESRIPGFEGINIVKNRLAGLSLCFQVICNFHCFIRVYVVIPGQPEVFQRIAAVVSAVDRED